MALSTRMVIVDRLSQPKRNLPAVAAALEKQVNRDFGKPAPFGWGMQVNIRVASKRWPARPDEWQLHLMDVPDMENALGYHSVTEDGQPIMKVFPSLSPGELWTVTASHEVLETLADPVLVWCAQDPRGIVWAAENCDACQGDTYMIDGVELSNFVTPYYFAPPLNATAAVGKMDHMGLIKRPYEIRPGGYAQWFDRTRGWVSVFAQGAPAAKRTNMGRRWHRWNKHTALESKRAFASGVSDIVPPLAPEEGMPPGTFSDADGGIVGVPLEEFSR